MKNSELYPGAFIQRAYISSAAHSLWGRGKGPWPHSVRWKGQDPVRNFLRRGDWGRDHALLWGDTSLFTHSFMITHVPHGCSLLIKMLHQVVRVQQWTRSHTQLPCYWETSAADKHFEGHESVVLGRSWDRLLEVALSGKASLRNSAKADTGRRRRLWGVQGCGALTAASHPTESRNWL